MNTPLLIGLTGSIASGKSTVGNFLQILGVPVLDLDRINRDLLDHDPRVRAVVESLTGGKLDAKDKPDRALLREIVFRDPIKRKTLEEVLHPLIWDKFSRAAHAHANQGEKFVICEAPLLVETGNHKRLNGLLVVTAPDSVRRARLLQRDGITDELADKMLKSQTPQEEKIKAATWVIENTGTLEELKTKTSDWLDQFKNERNL